MVSYKNFFYALSIMFALFNSQFIKSSELGEADARKHINHLLDSLFIPNNHPVSYQQHFHKFVAELTEDLTSNLGRYPHFYSFSKVYNDNQLYYEAIKQSLVFIEKCARNCAITEIQQYYGETTGNQKIFVDKVVSLIMKELKAKTSKTSILPQGTFTSYFGTALITKVHDLTNKELKKEASKIEKLNAKIKCPTCSITYDANNKKITLSCKHIICLACLKELWTKMGSAIECSKCNSKIDINECVGEDWTLPEADHTPDCTNHIDDATDSNASTNSDLSSTDNNTVASNSDNNAELKVTDSPIVIENSDNISNAGAPEDDTTTRAIDTNLVSNNPEYNLEQNVLDNNPTPSAINYDSEQNIAEQNYSLHDVANSNNILDANLEDAATRTVDNNPESTPIDYNSEQNITDDNYSLNTTENVDTNISLNSQEHNPEQNITDNAASNASEVDYTVYN